MNRIRESDPPSPIQNKDNKNASETYKAIPTHQTHGRAKEQLSEKNTPSETLPVPKKLFTQHPNHKRSQLHSPSPRHGAWRNPDRRTKIPGPSAGCLGRARDEPRAPRGAVPRSAAGLTAAGSWWENGPWRATATPRPPGWAEPIFREGGACRNPSGWVGWWLRDGYWCEDDVLIV